MSGNFAGKTLIPAAGVYRAAPATDPGPLTDGAVGSCRVDPSGALVVNTTGGVSASVVPTQVRNASVAVTSASAQKVAADTTRASLVVTNNGTVAFYFGKVGTTEGSGAAAAGGILLNPGCGLTITGVDATFAYAAVTTSGSSVLGYMETVA